MQEAQGIAYKHEVFGSFLTRSIFEDLQDPDRRVTNAVQRVLNKSILLPDLYPLEMLIRRIIDGAMDVDKGDYLRRDSYHCGVGYGAYDYDFLWKNVVITQSYQLGVLAKAALEAWSLTLARHRMFNYVYRHHVRNITDALLVEILQAAFAQLDGAVVSRDILPLRSTADVKVGEFLHKFVHWTDNSLLKGLASMGDSEISSRIEAFSSRKLYKRAFEINLNNYPNALGNEAEVIAELGQIKREMALQGLDWNVIPVSKTLAPVFERGVQKDILVQTGTGKETTLAEYLGFGVQEDAIREKGDTFLNVFADRLLPLTKNELKAKILSVLDRFGA